MKKLLLVLPLCVVCSGCVAAGYRTAPPAGGYPGRRPVHHQPMPIQSAVLPIGRWDNVMMLALESTVQVLMADGAVATGAVIGASTASLRIRVASGDIDVAAANVMRVDRLKSPGAGAVRDGVEGAAWGAGVVGVAGLILGRMPPPRLFAAGAIIGANHSIQYGRLGADAVTVYVSPTVVSASRPEVK
jgi:hypothetical protein